MEGLGRKIRNGLDNVGYCLGILFCCFVQLHVSVMTSEFQLQTFAFGDAAGNGSWLVSHFRNHLQYNNALAALSPPVEIPEFQIMTVEGGKFGRNVWLSDHQTWHQLIRPFANVTGIDLSIVDMDNESDFYQWMDAHNQEHQLLDLIFGV